MGPADILASVMVRSPFTLTVTRAGDYSKWEVSVLLYRIKDRVGTTYSKQYIGERDLISHSLRWTGTRRVLTW